MDIKKITVGMDVDHKGNWLSVSGISPAGIGYVRLVTKGTDKFYNYAYPSELVCNGKDGGVIWNHE